MAPRAAARLETLGFSKVFEYKAGKQDWFAAGLRAEGRDASEPTLSTVLRSDVPRFALADTAGTIAKGAGSSGWRWAAIVDAGGVLLGRVRMAGLEELNDGSATASDVMEAGPSTYRPNVGLDEMLRRMREKHFESAFVTDPDGRLRGLVTKGDIELALNERRKAS